MMFFFSSRRRHTRYWRDWSSDVCSSDLNEFTKRNLQRVGYADNPLEDGSLAGYNLHALNLTALTVEADKDFDLSRKDAARAKNMFALGRLSGLVNRSIGGNEPVLEAKFARKPEIRDANLAALKAGWNFVEA